MLVGESPGSDECAQGTPFVGASGQLLDSMLAMAGIDRDACSITNVFQQRPPRNDVTWFFGSKKEHGKDNPWPANKGKYLKRGWWSEVSRLHEEVAKVKPKIVVCLGGTALWALTGEDKITDHRGTLLKSPHGNVIPTFHPAAVLRDYGQRPVVISDLDRARRHVTEGLKETLRTIKIPESRQDLEEMFGRLGQHALISADVETEAQQITCISLSPTSTLSYVVPIWAKHEPGWSAWSLATEVYFWSELRKLAQARRLLFHNCVYDLSYLHEYGIDPAWCPHDTMLLHHAAQPELKKGLGFMASLYLDNGSWKWMRTKSLKDINKRDE